MTSFPTVRSIVTFGLGSPLDGTATFQPPILLRTLRNVLTVSGPPVIAESGIISSLFRPSTPHSGAGVVVYGGDVVGVVVLSFISSGFVVMAVVVFVVVGVVVIALVVVVVGNGVVVVVGAFVVVVVGGAVVVENDLKQA